MPTTQSIDGVDLYYQSFRMTEGNRDAASESQDGQVIFFVHGAGGNAASWWQQVPHFVDLYRILTLDHRGFARSRCRLE